MAPGAAPRGAPLGGATPGIEVPGRAPGAAPRGGPPTQDPQLDTYQRALAQVDTRARALFFTLRDLGQRSREQGFLGREDQRTLDQTSRQWDRLSQRLGAERDAARTHLTTLREERELRHSTTAEQERELTQAERRYTRLDQQQRARARVERELGGMLGGPPSGGDGGDGDGGGGGGRFAGLAGRAWQGLRRTVGPAISLVAGISAYQTITEAMRLYEQRARGIIDVGMQLDVNFDAVGRGIDDLRQRYRFLAHDSLAAMQVMQRITGSRAGLAQAAPFAAAYGIPLPQAAEMQALASRLTAGANPLPTMLELAGRTGGITPMGPGARVEETLSLAQIGAATGVQAPAAFYGRMAGLIGSMGDVYNAPGAQTRLYGQLAQGLAQAPDDAVLAIRMQALGRLREERVRAGRGTTMTIGEGAGAVQADLSTPWGLRVAASAAATQPDIIAAYVRAAEELTAGRPELAGEAHHRIVGGGQLGLVASEQLRQRRGRLATLGLPGGPATELGVEEIEARIAARQERPEFRFQAVEARWEEALEGIGRPLTKVALDIKETIATTAHDIQQSGGNVTQVLKEIGEGFANLSGEGKVLVGTLIALSSSSTLGQILGALTALAGVNQAGQVPGAGPYQGPEPQGIPGPAPAWISPQLWGVPTTQPQRPGP